MPNENDALDAAIRSRSRSGQPVIDTLNATVPQADPKRRAVLEQRFIDRLQNGDMTPERKPHMNYAPAMRAGVNMPPRRLRLSSSILIFAAVSLLCAAVVMFFSFNLPPQEDVLPVVAPPEIEQEQPVVLPSATTTPTLTSMPTSTSTPELTSTPTFSGTVVTMTPTSTPFAADSMMMTPTFTPVSALEGDVYYTVQEGDTLVGIADQYGLSVEQLMRMNTLTEGTPLTLGQGLLVRPITMVSTPRAWIPADVNVSEPNSTGMIVFISGDRLNASQLHPPLRVGETALIDLFTVVGVPPDQTVGAVGDGGDLAFSWVSVAASVQVVSVSDTGDVTVRAPLEQGIVLNWLLGDTSAPFYYERAE